MNSNIINLQERRQAKIDETHSHRILIPRAEVELLLKIAEARTIMEAKEKK